MNWANLQRLGILTHCRLVWPYLPRQHHLLHHEKVMKTHTCTTFQHLNYKQFGKTSKFYTLHTFQQAGFLDLEPNNIL
jgi:hypothetical protein